MTKITVDKVSNAKFWPGNIYFTPGIEREVMWEDVITAINRHCAGDWGDVDPLDRAANEEALLAGGKLFSVYHDQNGVKFWIITDADREATIVLLPDN